MKRDFDEQPDELPEDELLAKGVNALHASVASIIEDDEIDKRAALTETFNQFADFLAENLASDDLSEKRRQPMPYFINPIEFSKRVLAGEPTSCRRVDLFKAMQAFAENHRRPDETAEQALATYLMKTEDGRALYAAYRVLPNGTPEPVAKAVGPAPSPSFVALRKLAAELNRNEPTTYPTVEVAFAKVYADPRNRELVRKERDENRPGAEALVAKGTNVYDRIAALSRTVKDVGARDVVRRVRNGDRAWRRKKSRRTIHNSTCRRCW